MAKALCIKKDFEKFPSTVYAIYLYKTALTPQDIMAIQNKLRRCKIKYPYISYLLVTSNTDSKYCKIRKIRLKNKKGRPKEVVLGNKVPLHIHLVILGDHEHSAYKCAKDIQRMINKRFNKNICTFHSKSYLKKAKNFVNYSLKQANTINKCGIFDEILVERKVIASNYL